MDNSAGCMKRRHILVRVESRVVWDNAMGIEESNGWGTPDPSLLALRLMSMYVEIHTSPQFCIHQAGGISFYTLILLA